MSFGKAFATAFLNGLTGQIQKRSAEAVEERKRREENQRNIDGNVNEKKILSI